MRKKIITIFTCITALLIAAPSFAEEIISESSQLPTELSIHGRLEGIGTYFEIKDSEYLNVVLKSTEEIKIILESIPRMISISISSSTDSISTNLIISGLEPNKTYYKYQNSYQNGAVFVSDENGSYSWNQDLTQPHHVWIQEIKGTVFLPVNCLDYGTWDETTKTCTLNQDINQNVEILENNITLDCNGYKIIGSGVSYLSGYGIYLNNRENVTIKNCNVSQFTYGINLMWGKNNTFIDNTFDVNYSVGIMINYSSNNNLIGNRILNGYSYGLLIYYSANHLLRNNIISGNWINLSIISASIDNFLHDIDITNTVEGKPVYYLVNEQNKQILGDAGFVGIINSTNITVKDLTLTKNYDGILLAYSTNSTIENVTISNNLWGIHLFASPNNLIINNRILNNLDGVLLQWSSSNIVKNNNISNNHSGYNGIHIENSGLNIITDNKISNNGKSIYLYNASSNFVYHNNFINNINEPGVVWGYNNLFDNDYPSGGNYWSDYTGEDLYSGPNQDEPGSDGIGDTPYIFSGGQDRDPFILENGWETPSKWSFVIITDLHIGRGYSDYDGTGYGAGGEGEDYYLTERLKKVVDWINENKNNIDCEGAKCSIKFLAVLGDVADTAEKSEFLKTRKILDKLNDPNGDGNTADGIPYVPVFGNHDVWPYTENEETTSSLGEQYFDEIFWDENATNTKLMKEKLDFIRDDANPDYKNFAFKYNEINFIGLDFVKREKTAEANISTTTETWLKDRLNEYGGQESVILFSHHPFAEPFSRDMYVTRIWDFDSTEIEKIGKIMEKYENIAEGKQILGSFGGHIHGYYPQEILGVNIPIDLFFDANWEYPAVSTTSVVTTESLMTGSNEENPKGIIRIVKVPAENQIDYNNWEATEGTKTEFIGLNPYMAFDYTNSSSSESCMIFKGHAYTKREYSFSWKINDQIIGSGEQIKYCFSEVPKTYNVALEAIDEENINIKETIAQKIEVKLGIIPRLIKIKEELIGKIELISTSLWEDLTNFGRTVKDLVLIKVKHSEVKPTGLITVDFQQATQDIDLTNMVADTNIETKKSILYMSQWPATIENNKILFIPK